MHNRSFKAIVRRRKPRRRGTARLFVLSAAFAASATASGKVVPPLYAAELRWTAAGTANGPEAQDTQQLPFSIQPAPLGDVLAEFERITALQVILTDSGIATIQSPGVVGRLTARQALQQLLSGTSVAFTFTASNAVTLELRAPGEFIAVTGDGPAMTSPKFTEPLRDIPQTITVVPSSVIEAQGATTLRDVLRNVTGISIQAGEGGVPAGDNLSIRGFSARTDFFIDGVRDVGGYTRDPFNVEQVEVVKGPSSSIAGRGSTGGVINMATKMPHLGATRSLSLGLGSSDFKRGTLDINQPIADGAAFRLNAMWNDADTPGRDAALGRRPVAGIWCRRTNAGDGRLHASRSGQRARLRHSVGAEHQRAVARVCRPGPAGGFQQLLRIDVARLRGHEDRCRDWPRRARFRLRPEPAVHPAGGRNDT
jgi:catecholate siderophore receptor